MGKYNFFLKCVKKKNATEICPFFFLGGGRPPLISRLRGTRPPLSAPMLDSVAGTVSPTSGGANPADIQGSDKQVL